MNKWGYVALAGMIGATAGAIYNYLFAPAPETAFDGTYQSRLDWAIAEGEKAAVQREVELRAEFEATKLPPSSMHATPPLPPPLTTLEDAGNSLGVKS